MVCDDIREARENRYCRCHLLSFGYVNHHKVGRVSVRIGVCLFFFLEKTVVFGVRSNTREVGG